MTKMIHSSIIKLNESELWSKWFTQSNTDLLNTNKSIIVKTEKSHFITVMTGE